MPRWESLIGEFERGPHPSDGELTCDSICCDGHAIRKGAVVFFKQTSVEHDEWRPVCRKHAIEENNIDYSDITSGDIG